MLLSDVAFQEYKKYIKTEEIDTAKALLLSEIKENTFIYQYTRGDSLWFKTIRDKKIWMGNAARFNDPYDCAFLINKRTKEKYADDEIDLAMREYGCQKKQDEESFENQKSVFVSCFSETYTSNPMWAYYGNNQRGICVGYDLRSLIEKYNCFPVIYSEIMPEIQSSDFSYESILTKSNIWKHELEWRITRIEEDKKGEPGVCISFEEPKRLFLGNRYQNGSYDNIIRTEIQLLKTIKTTEKSNVADIINNKKDSLGISLREVWNYSKKNRIELYELNLDHNSFCMKEKRLPLG